MKYNSIYCGEVQEARILYLQQHKAATPQLETKFFFWSKTKHEMTDMYTIAIWTIKKRRLNK